MANVAISQDYARATLPGQKTTEACCALHNNTKQPLKTCEVVPLKLTFFNSQSEKIKASICHS
jgi:copper(I)-binding protein